VDRIDRRQAPTGISDPLDEHQFGSSIMRKTLLMAAAAASVATLMPDAASARTFVSVGFGAPAYPAYYGYPGYYAPPVAVGFGGYWGRPYGGWRGRYYGWRHPYWGRPGWRRRW
jgi:hypothetical protein